MLTPQSLRLVSRSGPTTPFLSLPLSKPASISTLRFTSSLPFIHSSNRRASRLTPPHLRSSTLSTIHNAAQTTTQKLSSRGITTMPPFNDAVVKLMRELYPEELADKSWDNTGLLVDQAPSLAERAVSELVPKVLLTNDLTAGVVDEALQWDINVIVCYHPVIFRPLKCLTTKDPLQAQLLRLIAAGITVYCPHTAVDAAVGGLNDWLCDILIYGSEEVRRAVAEPISRPLPGHLQGQDVGYGRSFELSQSITLSTLLKRLSTGIGGQRYMMVALPPTLSDLAKAPMITKIAVCAGSGADVLKNTDAQVLVTGEMAHHYALRHIQLGQIVVTCFHSNSERKFLEQRLKPALEERLQAAGYGNAVVLTSSADRDPFDIIDVQNLG
ncbi:GTP cyclohydrolase 1 type 2/Nif3 [Nemania sp. FL0916]|nr:GTP cyclohydrolase 1 type 2/Nif3 [Nemania sp. FL0916]